MKGFALLIVLWTIGFLALLGTQIVAAGRSDTQLATNLRENAVLTQAADGAVAHAVFMLQAARDPAWQPDGGPRLVRIGAVPVTVTVTVRRESDRVNINTASGNLLRALLTEVGEPASTANRLAAAIQDWRTSGAAARPNGAKAPDYLAAGRAYGPPGTPFQGTDELNDVLGMTPELYQRLAPHVTVLTDSDPDMSTRDPVVARALTDAAGVADDTGTAQQTAAPVFRIDAVATGPSGGRYAESVVAAPDFNRSPPELRILWRRGALPIISK
jgi:general secretion pathway protein K